jgi:MFS family permease
MEKPPPTERRLLLKLPRLPPRGSLGRDLTVGTIDAAAYSVMVGCGETYFPAFALAVGASPLVVGMVASVPLLVGASIQLASPLAISRVGGHRRWVILCTMIQAVAFVPMVWWALWGHADAWQLLAATSLYWGAGMAAAGAWYTWMAGLIPARLRATYFARRNRMAQAAVLVAFVSAALLLQAEDTRDKALVGFAILFTVAAIARLASTACLIATRDRPAARGGASEPTSPLGLMARIRAGLAGLQAGQAGRLVAFLCCFTFGIQLAGPYFTPYMLKALGFSYGQFLLVIAAGILVKALFLPSIGKLGSRIGPWRLLRYAGFAIVPLSLLWLPSSNVAWLVCVQLLAGTCWAAYELAIGLLLFEVAGDQKRGNVVGIYNLGIAVATVAGAGCGGLLLRWLGEDRMAYAAVFAASAIMRMLAVPLLLRLRKAEPWLSTSDQPPG